MSTRVQFNDTMAADLVSARNALGLSQTDLAAKLGKNRGAISSLEYGKVRSIDVAALATLETNLGRPLQGKTGEASMRAQRTASRTAGQEAMELIASRMTLGELSERSGKSLEAIVAFALEAE